MGWLPFTIYKTYYEIIIVSRSRYPGHRGAIGTFAYLATGLIHVLLVIAVIALILGFLRRDTTAI